MPEQQQRLLRYAAYLTNCTGEAAVYGRCVAELVERVQKGSCEKEFQALFGCVKKQIKRR